MSISVEHQVINHVCYRDVFNAPLIINSLKIWLNADPTPEDSQEFHEAITNLKNQKLIVEKDGFLAVYPKYELIDQQTKKDILTEELIRKGHRFLHLFSKLPFIKFIGISGSLAANNPTIDEKGVNKGTVDMDLFVICSCNSLWILFLFERVLTNLNRKIFGHHFYCFNYVTDETFLEVYNKNLYTATELLNLRTVYDAGVYDDFMTENNWSRKYYSNLKLQEKAQDKSRSLSLWILLAPLNYTCFALFCIILHR